MNNKYLNKITCGDCKEIIKNIVSKSIDLIILDPPYVTTKERWDQKDIITKKFIEDLYRVLSDNGNIYIWCGIGKRSQSLMRWFPLFNDVFVFQDMITWVKQRGIGMRKGWLYTREEILWFSKTQKYTWNREFQYSEEKRAFAFAYVDKEKMAKYKKSLKSDYKRITNVWTDIREPNISWNKKEIETSHYTPKPLKAIERIIKCHTISSQDVVLDPFMGSGTTAVACKKLDRNFIGIEKEQQYVDLANKRLKEIAK